MASYLDGLNSGDPFDVTLGYHFSVQLEGIPFGRFTAVSGLSVSYDLKEVKEGGENDVVHHLPGRATFGDITLTRPIDPTSGVVATFFMSMIAAASAYIPQALSIMTIEAFNPAGNLMAVWIMEGVVPKSYKGPNFKAENNMTIVYEELVFAHGGLVLSGSPI